MADFQAICFIGAGAPIIIKRGLQGVVLLLILVAGAAPLVSTEIQEPSGPAAWMEEFHLNVNMLLAEHAEEVGSVESKSQQASAAVGFIEKHIAVSLAAAHIYGNGWKSLEKQDQAAFTDALLAVFRQVMAENIVDFAGKTLEFKEEQQKGEKALVRYTVPWDKPSSLVYSLRKRQGKWLIFDINRDGVSLLRNFMSQLRPIIQREGLEAAVLKLHDIGEKSLRQD
ncbi:MAG: ABC transporter substrate-binding protein [Desulfopila sp.]|jgi:phospholipid transport system substrate-binding protein|nr:ABC transporter substrate-binding protein [Desulfopila sp.]